VIGSSAPQRALERLRRLERRAAVLGTVALPSSLTEDQLAGLAAAPLDESLLAAALARLDAGAVAAPIRSRPTFRLGRAVPGAEPSRAAVVSGAEPSRAAVVSGAQPSRAAAVASTPVVALPHRPEPIESPAHERAETAFAAAAARVPGGADAVATPVAANWVRGADVVLGPTDEPDEPTSGAREALRRALAAADPQSGDGSASNEPPPSSGLARRPAPPVAQPAADRPLWDEPVSPHRRGRLSDDRSEHHAADRRRPADPPLPMPSGAGGLAELVRRWEGGGRSLENDPEVWLDDPDLPGMPLDPTDPADPWDPPELEPLEPYDDDDALASALDRLLSGELRRHGIDPEGA
jgi:hypothetical protein